jgi:hypothetical protein
LTNTTGIASTFEPISIARKHQKIPAIPEKILFSDCRKVCWANQVKLPAKHQPTVTRNGRHFAGSFSLFTPGQGIPGFDRENPGKQATFPGWTRKKNLVDRSSDQELFLVLGLIVYPTARKHLESHD